MLMISSFFFFLETRQQRRRLSLSFSLFISLLLCRETAEARRVWVLNLSLLFSCPSFRHLSLTNTLNDCFVDKFVVQLYSRAQG